MKHKPDALPDLDVRGSPVDLRSLAQRASPFYSNSDAAAFLNLSPRTLEKMRVVGGGPPFCKLGRRVLYALPDLEAWAFQRKCDSTSDPAWKKPARER